MPVLLSNILLHLEVSAKASDYQPFSSDCQIAKGKERAQGHEKSLFAFCLLSDDHIHAAPHTCASASTASRSPMV